MPRSISRRSSPARSARSTSSRKPGPSLEKTGPVRSTAARLQAATSNDVEQEPILLWVEGDVGHGRGKPLALRLRDAADLLGFLGWQLGADWAAVATPAAGGAR